MPAPGLCRRIIPCLDVADGRTVKGVQFTGLRDVGDPVELACRYQEQGADELMFLDITATHENRGTLVSMVEKVAERLMIPFSVGGGVRVLEDARRLLEAGADKVSINSAAVARPELIREIAEAYGSQCCVLAIDAKRKEIMADAKRKEITTDAKRKPNVDKPEWDVLTRGGRNATGMDALEWAKQAVALGAGEILLTSWDKDGTRSGFDLELTKAFATGLPVPVIASGGAKGPDSFVDVFQKAYADAALAASIFHDGEWTVDALKKELSTHGVTVRL
ncbi:MAG: imidazole glycerol phosphate synthase subunit HisF [Vampirovibrionales bacterium]|nr:imidazole glycerol phosphate synthase subunit HisF [Vampirovibrionales bacterium]